MLIINLLALFLFICKKIPHIILKGKNISKGLMELENGIKWYLKYVI